MLVIDQFEEFLILHDEAGRIGLAALLNDLAKNPIGGLRLLLVFRSDYRALVYKLSLPPLLSGENWYEKRLAAFEYGSGSRQWQRQRKRQSQRQRKRQAVTDSGSNTGSNSERDRASDSAARARVIESENKRSTESANPVPAKALPARPAPAKTARNNGLDLNPVVRVTCHIETDESPISRHQARVASPRD
jgi:hypothetical protein